MYSLYGEGLSRYTGRKGQRTALTTKVSRFGTISPGNAGRKVDRLIRGGIAGTNHGEGHQTTFTNAHIADTEAGCIIVSIRTRTSTIIKDRTYADTINNFAIFRWITQGYSEGLCAFKNRILSGLHSKGLANYTCIEAQGATGRNKVVTLSIIASFNTG